VIGVINYRTGNSQSVVFALNHLGLKNRLVATPEECEDVERFILPGVGSAGVTMASLRETGWDDYLAQRVVREQRPFLGICVGLQVLFDWSDEHETECLGWLPGRVRELDRSNVRVPHMGWNLVEPVSDHPFVAEITPRSHFYFVNSFYAVPEHSADVAGATEYGVRFAAIVARGNIMATQFHTEKSGPVGLALLSRFATMAKEDLC
jgi:imidazole glycerol-phosphate synthase subunit HisH